MKVVFEIEVKKEIQKKTAIRACRHCGGHLRFYRGSHSCLMCGRDIDHNCSGCLASQDLPMENP
jgi:hypothetical protein